MSSLRQRWHSIPAAIRKPVVLTVGLTIVIISPITGALPGPGGIPIFLIGVAILSTEFEWARRIRDPILRWIHAAGDMWRRHKITGTIAIALAAACFAAFSYIMYRQFYA